MNITRHRRFEALVRRRSDMIEHVCQRFFAGDEYRQKAVSQDILLRLWEHFDERDDEGWVYRVCVNTAIDHYRRLRPERERLVPIEGIDICNPEQLQRCRWPAWGV